MSAASARSVNGTTRTDRGVLPPGLSIRPLYRRATLSVRLARSTSLRWRPEAGAKQAKQRPKGTTYLRDKAGRLVGSETVEV